MRFVRVVWALVFLIPIAPLAGRFCNLLPVDVVYHSLIFLHERLPLIFTVLAVASVVATIVRLMQARDRLRALLALASPLPERLKAIARHEAEVMRISSPRLVYLDVAEPECFATIGGPLIILSRGFIDQLSDDDLTLVMRHELAHVRHRHPLRGILVRLACAALLVPGFKAIERALYLRRESQADRVAAGLSSDKYDLLMVRLGRASSPDSPLCHGFTLGFASAQSAESARRLPNWTRFIPSGAAAALIISVAASHAFFDEHLTFLLTHHC